MADTGSAYSEVNLPVLLADALPAQYREACDQIGTLQESLIQWRKKKTYLEAMAGASGIPLPDGTCQTP